MRLINEDQILNLDFRKAVIDEIEGNENKARKAEAMKRYDIFKDKTKNCLTLEKKAVNQVFLSRPGK